MSKTPRLSRSGIEYILNSDGSQGYSWGVYSGCRNGIEVCPVSPHCWARSIAKRFPSLYPRNFLPTIYPEALLSPLRLKGPALVSVGWVGDLIGYADPDMDVPVDYLSTVPGSAKASFKEALFGIIRACPDSTFLFLTKNPERLELWEPFPKNAWVGVTACDHIAFAAACFHLASIEATVKWLSLEPLLDWDMRVTIAVIDQAKKAGIKWIVIGSQSNPIIMPSVEWVKGIVEACGRAGIQVWLKRNLYFIWFNKGNRGGNQIPAWASKDGGTLRHELPKAEHE